MLKGRAKPPEIWNGRSFEFIDELEGCFTMTKAWSNWQDDMDEGSPWIVAE